MTTLQLFCERTSQQDATTADALKRILDEMSRHDVVLLEFGKKLEALVKVPDVDLRQTRTLLFGAPSTLSARPQTAPTQTAAPLFPGCEPPKKRRAEDDQEGGQKRRKVRGLARRSDVNEDEDFFYDQPTSM